MDIQIRVLMIEDSEDDAVLLIRALRQGGYDPIFERVETAPAMRVALSRQTWDIVLSDYSMPHFSGPGALALFKKEGPQIPFIFISGTMGEDVAVQALKGGADDYLMKSNLKRLIPAVERALRELKMRLDQKLSEEKIKNLAYYDTLTGLPNRITMHNLLGLV